MNLNCGIILVTYCVELNLIRITITCKKLCLFYCCVGVSQVQGLKTSSSTKTLTFSFSFFFSQEIKWHYYAMMNNAKRLSWDIVVLTKKLKIDWRYVCGEGNSLEVLEALACLAALHVPAKHRAKEFSNMPARGKVFIESRPVLKPSLKWHLIPKP